MKDINKFTFEVSVESDKEIHDVKDKVRAALKALSNMNGSIDFYDDVKLLKVEKWGQQ